jgi:hypothetical protein
MEQPGVELHAAYVAVDCRKADTQLWTDRSRALAVVCVLQRVDRVLVDASDCDPAGHYALSDAITALMVGGVSTHLRLALFTNVSSLEALFAMVRRELAWLNVSAECFRQRGTAVDWLVSG